MKIQTPPGMRDFYPEEMRLQTWLFDHWRAVSRAFGFSEYESPIFEFTELYTLKSGDELTSQAFRVSRAGNEEAQYAIRPEMTPSLARMVAARANALSKPIKWFSIPRMCRAERPQRGRLREFFQWNVDTLGIEDPLADAEVIAVAVAFLQRVGLAADEVAVRISSRPVAAALLASLGIHDNQVSQAFQVIDKIERLPADEFARQWAAAAPVVSAERVRNAFEHSDLEATLSACESAGDAGRAAAEQFRTLWRHLEQFAIADYCQFDLKVVRGLAYYTGPVFEVYPRKISLRAIMGGGRYDSLTALLDGPKLPAVGFGMGDVTIVELLRELNKMPSLTESLDLFVIDAEERFFPQVLELAGKLRAANLAVDFSYKRQAVGKQFKQASSRGSRYAVVIGQELEQSGQVVVKDMAAGKQATVAVGELSGEPKRVLAALSAGNT